MRDGHGTTDERALDRKIDTAAWGVLLVWVGVALLLHVGWGAGLLGAGVITLAAQGWRSSIGVHVDRFSVVLGALLAVCGIWNVLELRVDVVPVLFIAAGVAILVSASRRHRPMERPTGVDSPAHPRV